MIVAWVLILHLTGGDLVLREKHYPSLDACNRAGVDVTVSLMEAGQTFRRTLYECHEWAAPR